MLCCCYLCVLGVILFPGLILAIGQQSKAPQPALTKQHPVITASPCLLYNKHKIKHQGMQPAFKQVADDAAYPPHAHLRLVAFLLALLLCFVP